MRFQEIAGVSVDGAVSVDGSSESTWWQMVGVSVDGAVSVDGSSECRCHSPCMPPYSLLLLV